MTEPTTEPVEPESALVERDYDPLALSAWSRITIAVVLATVIAIVASIVIYEFRSQSFDHDEKLRQTCASQGGDWRNGDCRFYNPFDEPEQTG